MTRSSMTICTQFKFHTSKLPASYYMLINSFPSSTFTASITSSILDYPVENGRRYHAFRSGGNQRTARIHPQSRLQRLTPHD
jgi:hypothetical protein